MTTKTTTVRQHVRSVPVKPSMFDNETHRRLRKELGFKPRIRVKALKGEVRHG
ncbi:hypothetical protein L598_000700001230 [Mesorhizobium sp. J18]|uniref:hypothetical protein n=1 Tax=Mesorhizobium sp. J18 TaxID=935263 RepID=UPI00119AE6FA|nr:hypothetical protein [Mesorhizobium sp. J18]TWG90366.1 hypothetical protein L598_000700001230 [Mesorhizobium sp. J18]